MASYFALGGIVYICIFYRLAYYFANLVRTSMSGHPGSRFIDRGIKPGIIDYIGALLWGPQLITMWPLVLLYYVFKNVVMKSKFTNDRE